MINRGFDFKRRDDNIIIVANVVLRVQYHGSQGLRSRIWLPALETKWWFGEEALQ